MTRLFRVLLLCAVSLFALAACVAAESNSPPSEAAAPAGVVAPVAEEAVADVAVTDAAVEGATVAEAPAAEVPAVADAFPVLDAPTEDFSLVGATGRPQFVNSFANW